MGGVDIRSPVIRLDPGDNVVVCRRAVSAGERLSVDGIEDFVATVNVPMGHKLACVHMPANSRVIKYGMVIGTMTRSAEPGEWVHLHNMRSNYIGAHTREATGEGT